MCIISDASSDGGAEPITSPGLSPTLINSKESEAKPVIGLTDSSKPVSPTLNNYEEPETGSVLRPPPTVMNSEDLGSKSVRGFMDPALKPGSSSFLSPRNSPENVSIANSGLSLPFSQSSESGTKGSLPLEESLPTQPALTPSFPPWGNYNCIPGGLQGQECTRGQECTFGSIHMLLIQLWMMYLNMVVLHTPGHRIR